MHDWIAVWDKYAQKTIIGQVVNKNAAKNSVIIVDSLHYIDNDLVSPSYQLPILYECPGCRINNPRYNTVRNCVQTGTYTTYTCTNRYNNDM